MKTKVNVSPVYFTKRLWKVARMSKRQISVFFLSVYARMSGVIGSLYLSILPDVTKTNNGETCGERYKNSESPIK